MVVKLTVCTFLLGGVPGTKSSTWSGSKSSRTLSSSRVTSTGDSHVCNIQENWYLSGILAGHMP